MIARRTLQVGNTLTVGNNGQFSTLDSALSYRDSIGHTELATGLTGTITYVAGEDRRIITLTGTPLSSLIHLKGIIGVRLGGAGNPILRATIIANNSIQLHAPIAATFTSVQVDVYNIIPFGISILPGSILELASSTTRIIPAYTTVFCPVPLGASIIHSDTSASVLFTERADQNYVAIKNLILGDSTHKINSTAFKFIAASATNNQTLCETLIQDCELHTASQDFLYTGSGTVPQGALHLLNNRFTGTYDVINPAIWRNLDVRGNVFTVHSVGDFLNGTGDGGQPTGIPIGNSGNKATTYPTIRTAISDNSFDISGTPAGDNTGVSAVALDIRAELPNQAVVDFYSNDVYCNKIGGAELTYAAAAGVMVGGGVGFVDTNTPTILVRNNTFDCKTSNSATGTAYSMHSNNATYVIKRFGNYVVNGTTGSNTAVMSTI